MSKFEDEIQRHRDKLDIESPNLEKMWAEVEKGLDEDKSKIVNHRFNYFKIAAAVLLLFGAGYFTHYLADQNSSTSVELSMADLSPELAEQEVFMQGELQQSLAKLASYDHADHDLEMFKRELEEIDRIDKELRQSMGKVKDYQRLLHTLLNHYERKIRIINKMIKEIERHEKNENRDVQTVI